MNAKSSVQTKPQHEQLGLSDTEVVEMYKYMVLARKFDERCLLLQRAGKSIFMSPASDRRRRRSPRRCA
ncbi:hypothetical protein HMSSN036_02650 [Paenibacillus macerans]|nr:hypothetical protein HMSSN036_02650 [Paenibacillus macerans]